jgi:GT2 family glycosyltransferase/glycosyltransferase involved in cell wall biosynthesis
MPNTIYKVILFGTGNGAEIVLDMLNTNNVEVIAFVDNNSEKIGTFFDKKPIISPQNIRELEYDYIIIASQFYKEISNDLCVLKIENDKIIPFFKYFYGNVSSFKDEKNLFSVAKLLSIACPNIRDEHTNFLAEILQVQTDANSKLYEKDIIIDVIIPIYNAFEETVRCIQTVYDGTDLPFELILIDDASTDTRILNYLNELKNISKPSLMQGLKIIYNSANLGFIQTINKGLLVSENHVVILNTDTEVPKKWLSRLIRPILEDNTVASVTPFSNSATICSFPRFCHNNELPAGMRLQEVDDIFNQFGGNRVVQLPTGVGFCMAMNRAVIREINVFDAEAFGKGYGEENDWCMRAYKAGYRSVLIPNLFVFHKHGASFISAEQELQRNKRIEANLEVVSLRHPEYLPWIHQFVQEDPIKTIRDVIYSALQAYREKKRDGILFINHTLGGGTALYEDELIKELRKPHRIYRLTIKFGCVIVEDFNGDKPLKHIIHFSDLYKDETFNRLMDLLKIKEVYINQLVTWPLFDLMFLVEKSKIPYTYFIHDYFCVCPSYNLLNSQGIYCGAETDIQKCNNCIKNNLPAEKNISFSISELDIAHWREKFRFFLQQATRILVPSQATKDIIKKYYINFSIEVQEHNVSDVGYIFKQEHLKESELHIVCIGAISYAKGAEIIVAVAKSIAANNLPIKLTVIGTMEPYFKDGYISPDGKFQVLGKYNRADLAKVCYKRKASVVLIPSIWPETFSYTAEEAFFLGYPVISFSMGAPAERIERYNLGWCLEQISGDAVIELIQYLNKHREIILEKAHNVYKYINRMSR